MSKKRKKPAVLDLTRPSSELCRALSKMRGAYANADLVFMLNHAIEACQAMNKMVVKGGRDAK